MLARRDALVRERGEMPRDRRGIHTGAGYWSAPDAGGPAINQKKEEQQIRKTANNAGKRKQEEAMGDEKGRGTLVMGVIGEDVHIVGIRILEYALKDAGFTVVSLGAQVSQQEFISAAVETNADGILVSSYSGHAEHLSQGFRDKCLEAGLGKIVLLIGGFLALEEKPWKEVEDRYKAMGFDGVYPPGTMPSKVVEDLKTVYFASKEARG